MLVKNAHVDLEAIIDRVVDPRRAQDVEGEILPLTLENRVRAVDPTKADAPGCIRLQTPAGTDKDMTEAHREAEVMVLRSLENRLSHTEEIDLVVAAKDAVVIAVNPPTQTGRDEFRSDLVFVRIADNAEKVGGLGGKFPMRRLEFVHVQNRVLSPLRLDLPGRCAGRKENGGAESQESEKMRSFHESAAAYFEFLQLQSRQASPCCRMKKFFIFVFIAAWAGSPNLVSAQDQPGGADQLAQAVWQASGGENWPQVQAIDFTFAVEKDGKTMISAEHHWDVAAQTDHVKWKDKDVTVNLAEPASDEKAKAAFARWTNDSYWLLAPLKLRDHGSSVANEGNKEMDGKACDVMRLSFGKVGLTPNDQYNLYIDPKTKLISSWDYMPEPGKSMHATWTDYQKSGGLTLATDHQMDGGVRIRILNLKVTSKK